MNYAKIVRKTEMFGLGAVVQVLGILLVLGGFIPGLGVLSVPVFVLGLILIVIGGRMSLKLMCSDCGTTLASKTVTVCPACHVRFSEKKAELDAAQK